MGWYTTGQKADRMVEGALLGAGMAFVKAIANGKTRPWLHAATGAVSSGAAMGHHRRVDRARANEEQEDVSERVADAMSALIDMQPPPTAAALRTRGIAIPTYARIVGAWNEAVKLTGRAPGLVTIPRDVWVRMSESERTTLVNAARRDGVALEVTALGPPTVQARR